MLINSILPLVNWNLGTAIIVLFGAVCLILMLVVNRMVHRDERKKDNW